jgi:oligosaccharyltransferase complex subunit beta
VVVKDVSDATVHLSEFGAPIYSDFVVALRQPNNFKFMIPDDSMHLQESVKARPMQEELQAAKLAEIKRPGVPGLSMTDIVNFFDSGRNVVVLANGGSGASNDLQALLAQFGTKLLAESVVKNFFGPVKTSGGIKSEPWIELISGGKAVEYSGSAVGIDSTNANVFFAARAGETAFQTGLSGQGLSLGLAAANQGTNGARFLVVGSVDLEQSFAKNILSWTFGKRGVLRARDLYHHRVGEQEPPRMYKEKDQIEVGLKIEELKDGKWMPFPAMDVQLEYVMLDPYVRETMKFTGTGHKLVFTAPDVYGIFKFKIDYKRRGFNPVKVEQVAPVRNMRHNDYERFLFSAYPYYASCFVTLGLVLGFTVLFLNHKESGTKDNGKEARHRE